MLRYWRCDDCGDDALVCGPGAYLNHQNTCPGFATCPTHGMRHRGTEPCPLCTGGVIVQAVVQPPAAPSSP